MEDICQSCGMEIEDDSFRGTENGGLPAQDYCIYCYVHGELNMDMTFERMLEIGTFFSEEYQSAAAPEEKERIRSRIKEHLSTLKRWR